MSETKLVTDAFLARVEQERQEFLADQEREVRKRPDKPMNIAEIIARQRRKHYGRFSKLTG